MFHVHLVMGVSAFQCECSTSQTFNFCTHGCRSSVLLYVIVAMINYAYVTWLLETDLVASSFVHRDMKSYHSFIESKHYFGWDCFRYVSVCLCH